MVTFSVAFLAEGVRGCLPNQSIFSRGGRLYMDRMFVLVLKPWN